MTTCEMNDEHKETYRLGKSVGEKDAIRFMVKSFMHSIQEEHLLEVYDYFERQYYKGKDKL